VKRLTVLLLVVFGMGASSLAVAARTVPIEDREGIAISGNKSVAEVKSAITQAAGRAHWSVVADKPGVLRLQYERKEHEIVIDVPYNEKSYGLKYVSSVNMNYSENGGTRTIHRTYAKRTAALIKSIRARLGSGKGAVTESKDDDDE
jgi:hypothetical protein